ncbi:Putative metabolite transport protein YjhB [Sporomusa rhizae]|uniref:MFS transporter n=1 Tax=Sporomusa rhizae TaxID=357999 RepID=UPI00352ADA03
MNSTAAVNTIQGPWYKQINRLQWNALLAAFLGWALDAFDFLLYNFTIVTLIKEWGLTTTETGLVASSTVIASALGGVLFGWIADRIGRMKALTMTILLYSLATGACGLSQNIWQLMAARLLVGLGMGGEWSAGAALISETWPKEHRGKAMSIMQSGYAVGGLVAAFIAGPIIQTYGWRILFVIGILPAVMVYWIRRHVEEPAIWKNQNLEQATGNTGSSVSILEIFRGNLLKVTVIGSLFCIVGLGASYPISIWLPAYLGTPVAKGGAGLPIIQSSLYVMPYYIGSILGYWVFGFLSDTIGRKRSFALYFVVAAVAIPACLLAGTENLVLFFGLLTLVGFVAVGFYGGFGAVLAELYPTHVRGTGQGFCYNLARGIAAFAITGAGALANSMGIGKALMYSGGIFILALIATMMLPETKGKELD